MITRMGQFGNKKISIWLDHRDAKGNIEQGAAVWVGGTEHRGWQAELKFALQCNICG